MDAYKNNKLHDIKEKMILFNRVATACEVEIDDEDQINVNFPLKRAKNYLGIPLNFINDERTNLKTNKYLKKSMPEDLTPPPSCSFTYKKIRDYLLPFYVKNQLPTISDLEKTVSCESCEWCEVVPIHQNLERQGFIIKMLPMSDAYVIMEKPEVLINRMGFLEAVDQFRQCKRKFVYVKQCPGSTVVAGESFSLMSADTTNNLEIWMENVLVPKLPLCSVVVISLLKNSLIHSHMRTPDLKSTKDEIILWLQLKHIPYTEEMHWAELLKLAQKFKAPSNLYKLQDILKSYGHDLLIRPTEMGDLDLFKFNKKGAKYYSREKDYIQGEKKQYAEDYELESAINKFFENGHTVTKQDFGQHKDDGITLETVTKCDYIIP